jgi:hypothetical protein
MEYITFKSSELLTLFQSKARGSIRKFMNTNKGISVRLVGGLGNQLFGYSAAVALAGIQGARLHLHLHWTAHRVTGHNSSILDFRLPYLDRNLVNRVENDSISFKFSRKLDELTSKFEPLKDLRGILDFDSQGVFESLHTLPQAKNYWGYFQSWKFVVLAHDFELPSHFTLHTESLTFTRLRVRAAQEKPIGIHVRRGDYLNHQKFGTLSKKYYERAVGILRDLGHLGPLWLFSSDKSVLHEFPSMEPVSKDLSPAEEMILMSSCDANVIANSTFSWWSAWLNSSTQHVICPDPWFRSQEPIPELLPPWWKKMAADWR